MFHVGHGTDHYCTPQQSTIRKYAAYDNRRCRLGWIALIAYAPTASQANPQSLGYVGYHAPKQ